MRPKSQWTEHAARESIMKSTGLSRAELVSAHSKKAYIWRVRA